MDYWKVREKLEKDGYVYHHRASHLGYISRRKGCEVHPYEGMFGKGFKVLIPRYDTTKYCTCEYYILRKTLKLKGRMEK